MLTRNKQVKQKTRVDKINSLSNKRIGRSKSTELPGSGIPEHKVGAAQANLHCGSQSRRATNPSIRKSKKENKEVTPCYNSVPVISKTGKVLMPCSSARARELLKKNRAEVKHLKGMFYIKLLDREDGEVQNVCLGIDPGSKREAFTVKSSKHTYINILINAVDWVKDAVETRRNMRRSRRFRKTPCRKNRYNRKIGGIPPSTKARWQAKLRVTRLLFRLYSINTIIVEDISAKTIKNGRKWNVSFSPLEVGKEWFYEELRTMAELILREGYYTKNCRDILGLKKTSSKLENVFSAHNIDSWILANDFVGLHKKPDNESILRMIPLKYSRRQLHMLQASEGGIRKRYGGTKSGKFTKGMLVYHQKYRICYVGGYIDRDGKLGFSLHNLLDGRRLCQEAKFKDINILCYNSWRYYRV